MYFGNMKLLNSLYWRIDICEMMCFGLCSDNDSYWPNADIEYRLQSSVGGFAVDSLSGTSNYSTMYTVYEKVSPM